MNCLKKFQSNHYVMVFNGGIALYLPTASIAGDGHIRWFGVTVDGFVTKGKRETTKKLTGSSCYKNI